jgi:hypothetical protein
MVGKQELVQYLYAIEQFQVSVAPYDVKLSVLLVVPLVLLHVQEQIILKDLLTFK